MPRVLIVDDEPLIATMLAEWIVELGHDTVGPANTDEAATLLIETASPDAVILDVSLAGGNSFALAAMCRQRALPFAFATGYGRSKLPPDFASERLLRKPFTFEEVKRLLAELLGP